MTIEGRNYLLAAGFKGAVQSAAWYVAPFKANYTPLESDTATGTVPLLNESIAYEGMNRAEVTLGTPNGGSLDNSGSILELVGTETETWYGVILISTPTKGQAAGVLMRVKKWDTPVSMSAGQKVQILVDLDLTAPV